MNKSAMRSGKLKPPQIIDSHCQLHIAPMHCADKIPNVPAAKNIKQTIEKFVT